MFVRPCRKEDAVNIHKIFSVAFESGTDLSKIDPDDFKEGVVYGAYTGTPEEPGELTSIIYLNRYVMYFDGKPANCIGIGGVATLPQYRRNGGIRAIFNEGFKFMKENDYVFASLFPFSYEYYNKFGFQATSQVLNIRVPMTELARFEANTSCYLCENNADEGLRKMYEEHAKKHNLAFTGDSSGWHRYARDPYKSVEYTYVYKNDAGEPAGYFKYTYKDGGNRVFKVTELYYRTVEDLKGILGFIKMFCSHSSVLFERIPYAEDFTLLFTNYYSVDRHLYFNSMARVVIAERAFELMRYPEDEGKFSMKITDRTAPWNNGVFTVSYKNGALASLSHAEEGDYDIAVTDTALARVMLGTDDILSQFMAFDSGIEIKGNKETLAKVFRKRPQILYDSF